MRVTILFISMALFACKKGSNPNPQPNPTPVPIIQDAGLILWSLPDMDGNSTSLGLYDANSTILSEFNVRSDGEYKIQYISAGGGPMMRGNLLGSSTTQCSWANAGRDTIRVLKANGELFKQFILIPFASDNTKHMKYEKRTASESCDNLKIIANNFASSVLAGKKWKMTR